ncbi:hypothetical protein [Candidatus Reidiella endopervernicosa]|uniref:Lipoprotein n=1 Tax=Candidatus Reidiella endopervernicosa TaxID=2738883 RepID=A0A6N0HSD0_9GAMM|nr:hypothetical protein [Candidatus Reidiella endopervernicosa]QKQ25150.1 hypothetical protein HUE57_01740 [Candidatus Reidiella endopervernicosa]
MNKLTALFVVTMILYGCDSSDTAKRTPEQIKAEVEANQNNSLKKRSGLKRRIKEELSCLHSSAAL